MGDGVGAALGVCSNVGQPEPGTGETAVAAGVDVSVEVSGAAVGSVGIEVGVGAEVAVGTSDSTELGVGQGLAEAAVTVVPDGSRDGRVGVAPATAPPLASSGGSTRHRATKTRTRW